MSIRIKLTKTELMVAAYIGSARNVQSLHNGAEPGAGIGTDDTWTPNIEGAAGEMAVAKALDIYWVPLIGKYGAPDVGKFEVRTNGSRDRTDMNLRPRDFEKGGANKIWISVLSFNPWFEIVGWIRGADGRQPQWFHNGTPGRPPSWWVPATALHDIELLMRSPRDEPDYARLSGAA